MKKLTGQFDFYNPQTHQAVCPIDPDGPKSIDLLLKQIGQIDCEIVGEIAMPIDLFIKVYLVQLPKWLKYKEDDGDSSTTIIHDFADEKDRVRLETFQSRHMVHTRVYTRYIACEDVVDDDIERGLLPCVYDSEDKSDSDDPKPIWVGKRDEKQMGLWDGHKVAEKWLDENYPNWRNPTAYWS